jgi:hypothetical protein
MLAFRLFPFVEALLIVVLFILPLKKLSFFKKLLLSTVLTLCCLKLYVYVFTGGDMMDPKLSRYPAMFCDIGYFFSIFVFIFLLLRLFINGLYKLISLNIKKYVLPPHSMRYALLFMSMSFMLSILGVYNGFALPKVKNYDIAIQDLAPAADNYKIALLADLHISAPTTLEEISEIVAMTNALSPDLIIIAGDFVDGSIPELHHMTRLLFDLKAKDGIYAVSGNHELYSNYIAWIHYFTEGGIRFLENKATLIKDEHGTGLFNLAGIIDISATRFNLPRYDIVGTLSACDAAYPIVFLSHQPKIAPEVLGKVDLMLSGHTHGGLMPGLREIVARANNGFVSGLYDLGKTRVIVSNGTRIWAGAPLRINNPAEISLITLKTLKAPEVMQANNG